MGSVIDYINCPVCNDENCSDDYYYKSDEQYINCGACGYSYRRTIKRDEKGNIIFENDVPIYETQELKNPYGAFCLRGKDAIAYECGSFQSKEQAEEFEDFVKKTPEVVFASISRLVDGKITRTALIGDLKERFND